MSNRPQNATYVLTAKNASAMQPMMVAAALAEYDAVHYKDGDAVRFHVKGLDNAYGLRGALTMSTLEDIEIDMEVLQ